MRRMLIFCNDNNTSKCAVRCYLTYFPFFPVGNFLCVKGKSLAIIDLPFLFQIFYGYRSRARAADGPAGTYEVCCAFRVSVILKKHAMYIHIRALTVQNRMSHFFYVYFHAATCLSQSFSPLCLPISNYHPPSPPPLQFLQFAKVCISVPIDF